MMRFLLTLISLFVLNITFAQSVDVSGVNHTLLDSLLKNRINEYRIDEGLSKMYANTILDEAADHHSKYMARATIVSHFQEMTLPGFYHLHSPKDRIMFFSDNTISNNNHYSEIVMGIKLKNVSTYHKLADALFKAIINSENKAILNSEEACYIGLSVNNKKHTYFTTIKIGMGYNNIVALLEES